MKHFRTSLSPALAVSYGSIAVNLALSGGKLAAGLIGHSRSMLADAAHSASDVASTVIIIIALAISARSADKNHEYGHEKFETLATVALSLLLFWTGWKIGWGGVTGIIHKTYLSLPIPTLPALIAAVCSIVVKEVMFQITYRVGKREQSTALVADAWHHRSDALSSVGSLAGIGLSMLGLPVMDSVASIVISVFVIKAAYDIFLSAVGSLTDESCGEAMEQKLRTVASQVEGVIQVDRLLTRRFGSGFYVDLEITADGTLSLHEAHDIAQRVHDQMEAEFPSVKHCMVHVNPAGESVIE